jgi:NAD(P)-dependent dehydrogenase (short-subunit alcohol dehydrogenase family)
LVKIHVIIQSISDGSGMKFSGANIYISGGTSGIGLGLAERFCALGANVYAVSIDSVEVREAALQTMQAACKSANQKLEAAYLDVTDPEATKGLLKDATESFGPADVLVNSAGMGGAVYFDEDTYERFDTVMKVNLYGTRNTVAALLPGMKKGGSIVNIASMAGVIGLIGYTAYSSAKFSVVGFSQALRSELKPKGIWVSVVCPAQVDTPMLQKTDAYKPPEVKEINNNAGILTAGQVADAVIDGIKKRGFMIVPGVKGKVFFHLNRLLPKVREFMTDQVIRKVQKRND